jgi:hypothetical protein
MKTCIFTRARDAVFLELWLKYYSKYIQNIFVIDNLTLDGSIERCQKLYNFNIINDIYVPYNDHVNHWNKRIKKIQQYLFNYYDVVIYADTDEIIVSLDCPLDTYIENMKTDYITCTGYDVIDINEIPINLDKPILEQRKYWFRDKWMDKTLISKIPINWEYGFHWHDNINIYDEKLLLIHLNRVDYNLCIKYRKAAEYFLHRQTKEGILKDYDNRFNGENKFDKYYYCGISDKPFEYTEIDIPKNYF